MWRCGPCDPSGRRWFYDRGSWGLQTYGVRWLDALGEMVRTLRSAGSRVLVLGPLPEPGTDVPRCAAAHAAGLEACNPLREEAIDEAGIAAERVATVAAGGDYADLTLLFCGPACRPVVIGNTLVFVDDDHLSASYVPQMISEPAGQDRGHRDGRRAAGHGSVAIWWRGATDASRTACPPAGRVRLAMTQSVERNETVRGPRSRRGVARALAAVVSAVRLICGLFALILVLQIAFVLFGANPDKWITRVVADWSDPLTLGLRNLFSNPDPMIAMGINYGIAAVAWLVIGAVLARILRGVFGRRVL